MKDKETSCPVTKVCPRCRYPITGALLVCPRCREVLETGCTGNCSRCGK